MIHLLLTAGICIYLFSLGGLLAASYMTGFPIKGFTFDNPLQILKRAIGSLHFTQQSAGQVPY
jgi:hypothetical protein